MKNANQTKKGVPVKKQTPGDIIQSLISKRHQVEERIHQTNEKIALLIKDSYKFLHPGKPKEK
jgi:hypothetical protein